LSAPCPSAAWRGLRPLEILKWIVIPLLLILVMIYRPTGLIAFKEFDVRQVFGPKEVD
jgi:branched-chain amino acid transport system permease protein